MDFLDRIDWYNHDGVNLGMINDFVRNQFVPRMGMQQDKDVLYLDVGHWGPGENPVLLINPQRDVLVKHNVRNGIITYSLRD